jgi:hypothetical protein
LAIWNRVPELVKALGVAASLFSLIKRYLKQLAITRAEKILFVAELDIVLYLRRFFSYRRAFGKNIGFKNGF